jgi:hypothetical protein
MQLIGKIVANPVIRYQLKLGQIHRVGFDPDAVLNDFGHPFRKRGYVSIAAVVFKYLSTIFGGLSGGLSGRPFNYKIFNQIIYNLYFLGVPVLLSGFVLLLVSNSNTLCYQLKTEYASKNDRNNENIPPNNKSPFDISVKSSDNTFLNLEKPW